MQLGLESMPIAVTGAGGFVGPAVVHALLRRKAQVRAIIGVASERTKIASGAECVGPLDICDGGEVRRFVRGSEVVVHLAGPPSVSASFDRAPQYIHIHTEGTATVLEACRAEGVGKIVYISSAQVYGRPQQCPVAEDHPLAPRSPYGAAKVGAEKLIEAQVHAFGSSAVILRPFSIYGPGASAESLVAQLFQAANSGLPISVDSLSPIRDYCFVADVAEAIALACQPQREPLEIFNIGTMRGTSIGELVEIVMNSLRVRLPVVERPIGMRPNGSEIHELVADNRWARGVLGWEPVVALESGLRAMAARETWQRVA